MRHAGPNSHFQNWHGVPTNNGSPRKAGRLKRWGFSPTGETSRRRGWRRSLSLRFPPIKRIEIQQQNRAWKVKEFPESSAADAPMAFLPLPAPCRALAPRTQKSAWIYNNRSHNPHGTSVGNGDEDAGQAFESWMDEFYALRHPRRIIRLLAIRRQGCACAVFSNSADDLEARIVSVCKRHCT
jgi:hypothetical protein